MSDETLAAMLVERTRERDAAIASANHSQRQLNKLRGELAETLRLLDQVRSAASRAEWQAKKLQEAKG